MGIYGERLQDLTLYRELQESQHRHNLVEYDVRNLTSIVHQVDERMRAELNRIHDTFREYTEHDIRHSYNVIGLMGDFIPRDTLIQLNALELAILILSALLHDSGMIVGAEEKRAALASKAFEVFFSYHPDYRHAIGEARDAGDLRRAVAVEDALLAEFFRQVHPERSAEYVESHFTEWLVFHEYNFACQVATICASHGWGIAESHDARDPKKAVCELDSRMHIHNVPVNMQYLACCLRLADILDFDRTRTPVSVFRAMDFASERSWTEWQKHLQVRGWNVTEHEVAYEVPCSHPAFYVAINEFLDAVDKELRECRYLLDSPHSRMTRQYALDLPHVADRRGVTMKDPRYVSGGFKFELDYENILKLLMDKSLYPDPCLFLRELLQNSLDACRRMEALAREAKQSSAYKPRIVVWDHSDDPNDPRIVFQDNGIGMSLKIVENYFMRVGRSYYRSEEFQAERERLASQGIELDACSCFGIGILSCFIAADWFEVETYRAGYDPLHITLEGPSKYFVIRRLQNPQQREFMPLPQTDEDYGPPNHPGTRVTVHLNASVRVDAYRALGAMAANLDYDLRIYPPGRRRAKTVRRLEWEGPIHIKDFPESIGSRHVDWRDEVANGLDGVVVASHIPLQKWDFSRHLRGQAWFWLLRSEDGHVAPQTGYLRIGSHLELTGLPEYLRMIQDHLEDFHVLHGIGKLAARFRKSIDDPEYLARWVDWLEHNKFGNELKRVPLDGWLELSRDEQEAAYHSLAAFDRDSAITWAAVPGLASRLASRSLDWPMTPVWWSTSSSKLVSNYDPKPQMLSIRGIVLPAGIADWNPLAGTGASLQLLPAAGGALIDARGPVAPIPSANRLFIDPVEGEKIAVPYARAALRHLADLVESHPGDPEWCQWLDSVFFGISHACYYYWLLALNHDIEYLEERIPYKTWINGTTVYLTRDQLVDHFGRWVPLALEYSGFPPPRDGVVLQGRGLERMLIMGEHLPLPVSVSAPKTLLFFHPSRVTDSRCMEFDMAAYQRLEGNELIERFSWWCT